MSIVLMILISLIDIAVKQTGSHRLAFILPYAIALMFVAAETLVVTVFPHRHLTHGAFKFVKADGRPVKICLWLTRSGGVKFTEWPKNHAAHHINADKPKDVHSPWVYHVVTKLPALKRPSLWNFWENGLSYYRKYSKDLRNNPDYVAELMQHRMFREVVERLDELEWAKETYERVIRALFINWGLFVLSVLPWASDISSWWIRLVVVVVMPWALIGAKLSLYLAGGAFINYWGHRNEEKDRHQSNIPILLMLVTFFMMGEAWHMLHHDAPYSAQLHPHYDPGWWTIRTWSYLRWVDPASICIASKTSVPRQYKPAYPY